MNRGRRIRTVIRRPNWCPKRSLVRFIVLAFVVLLVAWNQHRFAVIRLDASSDNIQLLSGGFRIHVDWHPQNRRDRFPSVQERVKLYMGNWYSPNCNKQSAIRYRIDMVPSSDGRSKSWPILNVTLGTKEMRIFDCIVMPDQWFLVDGRVMKDCARKQWKHVLTGRRESPRVQKRRNMRPYCSDVLDLLEMTSQMDKETTLPQQRKPLLAYFGDGARNDLALPFFAKYRSATTKQQLAAVTADDTCVNATRSPLHTIQYSDMLKPILWKLESSRHFGPLHKAHKLDTPWQRKKNRAFWAGDMTGHVAGDSDLEKCRSNQRCRFVLEHAAHSKLIDCGLTRHGLSSDTINGTNILTPSVGMKHIQRYKVIISMEGNDIASGLKWSLLSESVVLMPAPTQTSCAMEETLEPWVHYVPMKDDGSDADEMVQWILDHDEEAQRIAERATLFMYDLVYHPDAAKDDRLVKEEILHRYRALWQ